MPFYYDFDKQHDNSFLHLMRSVYHPLGFHRGYNFPLWVIFGGAILGFGCARAKYLDINGTLASVKIPSGDWEYFQSGHYYVGIVMHLAAVIPICFLVPWQFLPIIRHKALWFHRINGYLLVILLLLGNAGALMITRHALGGGLDVQALVGMLAVYTTISLFMAYYNIKRLQIDQHRAWMLRTWFLAASIISLRLIQYPARLIVTRLNDFYFPMACHTINFITSHYGPSRVMQYPACRLDPVNGWAAVKANWYGAPRVEEIGAVTNITFGTSGLIAFFLHAVGVELYLHLTTAERERLRQISYEKQVERNLKRPGSSGLTVQTWGDSMPWQPREEYLRRTPPSKRSAARQDLEAAEDCSSSQETV